MPTTGRLKIDLIKGLSLRNPRVESDEFIMIIGSDRPMEDTARILFYPLFMWIELIMELKY